jgi:hypothetical protein
VGTTFTHFSLNREYDSTATKVVVTYFVNGWDDDHHDLACTLILDGTPESPDSTVKTPDPSDPAKYKIEFTFDGVSEDDVDNIKTVGSTDGAEYGFFTITDRWDHAYA